MFTPVSRPAEQLVMGLAPMAVEPRRQRAGIGTALVKVGLEHYPRFGFVPASRFGLGCEYDVPPEVFMALELQTGTLRCVSGTVKYHAAFAEVEP